MQPSPTFRASLVCAALLASVAAAAGEHDARRGPPDRVVAVSGSGDVLAVPDRALVMLAVEARNASLQSAQQEVNGAVERFLALADELRVPREQVQTTSANVQAEFDWNPETRERRMLGYYVSRQLRVELRELDKLGPLMERSVGIGVNQVSPPHLVSSRADELRREALSKAADDARRSAEALAKTLGARVGPVRRIASSDVAWQPPPQPYERTAMAMKDGGGAATYEAGQIEITAQVTAEFDLVVD
jgi:uncharacterized protein